LRVDLDAAVKSAGPELDDEERQAVQAIDLSSLTDQQLEERISKQGGGRCSAG